MELKELVLKLNFKPTTKKKLKYKPFIVGVNGKMPSLTYSIASDEQEVITYTSDGEETRNTAYIGDYIFSGINNEQYVLKAEKVAKLYTPFEDGLIPERSPRRVAQVTVLVEPIYFKAPWGEDMILKQGDYLVKDGNDYYRIAKAEYELTYNPPGIQD